MSTTWQMGVVTVLGGLVLPWAAAVPAAAADRGTTGQRDEQRTERRTEQGAADAAEKRGGKNALEPGDTRGARVVKAGWWWAANEPPPETGLVAAPQPPTPTIPKGSIPVGALAGEPEKVSALEVKLKARPGATVKKFRMVLRESVEPGANANADEARILACPVTELFWADGSAAAWKDQPTYDCGTKAVGKRTSGGLWRFDLTDIAADWLAVGNTSSRSVVLVEDVAEPESFQVTLDGVKAEGIGLSLVAAPPLPTAEPPAPSEGTGGTTGAGVGGGGGGSGLGAGGGSLGDGGSPALVGGGAEPRVADSAPQAASGGGQQGEVALTPVGGPLAWYSGLPRISLLLVPLGLALAYLIMLALGPDARPVPATGRHGVSRALDRLRQTGRDLRGTR